VREMTPEGSSELQKGIINLKMVSMWVNTALLILLLKFNAKIRD
jgi:hypothetical protein